MDVRCRDGDIDAAVSGDYVYISGLDEAIQRVRIVALTDLGSFIYDRTLGVDYDALSRDEADPVGKLDMLLKEATADLGGIGTEVLSYDAATSIVGVKVTYNGRSAVTEVNLSGLI